jgi:DNA-binding CsgD family transcriptional regulator
MKKADVRYVLEYAGTGWEGSMTNSVFILFIAVSLAAGLFAILTAYRLNAKFGLGHLSTYLYFHIFVVVFGVYGLIGQAIVRKILERQAASFQTVETVGHFFSFLGLPFLMLAWYMFIRLSREIIDKAVGRAFTLGYFLILALSFVAYGTVTVIINTSRLGDKEFAGIASAVAILFEVIEAAAIGLSLPRLFVLARKIQDRHRRKAVMAFGWLNLAAFGVRMAIFVFAGKGGALNAFYIFVFFAGNLAPLLAWKGYLEKHAPPLGTQLQGAPPRILREFLEEYGITKREEEVIREICDGKTNREIGESLFISLQTVKDHIYRIFQKANVKNRVQLINLIRSYKGTGEEAPGSRINA